MVPPTNQKKKKKKRIMFAFQKSENKWSSESYFATLMHQNQGSLHQILKIKEDIQQRETEDDGSLPTSRPTSLNSGVVLFEQPPPK